MTFINALWGQKQAKTVWYRILLCSKLSKIVNAVIKLHNIFTLYVLSTLRPNDTDYPEVDYIQRCFWIPCHV